MNLIQIVTGLPPQIDGIGDYSMQLARQLRTRHAIETSFVVCGKESKSGEVEGFAATGLAARDASSFLQALEERGEASGSPAAPILLHFSPYGYQKRGCPFWLAEALEKLEQRHPGRVNVVYHELEATGGRPWSSTFWVPRLQQNIISRIARLGRFQYTNIELHRGKLEAWGSGRIPLIPNFSGLGEPAVNPPFAERKKQIVIFGRGAQRSWTYERGTDALVSVCRSIGAERIIDIGEPLPRHTQESIGGIPVHRCGRLPAQEVDQWMATSLATFSYYPAQFLGKSSGYAASCANGAVPFIFDNQEHPKSCPGLIAGEDFIPVPPGRSDLPLLPLQELSAKVFSNYQERSSAVTADKVASALFSNVGMIHAEASAPGSGA